MTDNNPESTGGLQAMHVDKSLDIFRDPIQEKNPSVYPAFSTWQKDIVVRSLTFDKYGNLWGAGWGGVVRWIISQSEVKYKIWRSEHGLAGNDALTITTKPDGKIVCGHESGWLSIFEDNTWYLQNSDTDYAIRHLGYAPDGALLASTDRGLFNVDTASPMGQLPSPPIASVTAFDKLWIATENGLYYHDDEAWIQPQLDEMPDVINSMRFINNTLWLAGLNGIYRLRNNHQIEHILRDTAAIDFVLYGDGLVVNTLDGLIFFDENNPDRTRKFAPTLAEAIVANTNQVIYTLPQNVRVLDHLNEDEFKLFPEQSQRPVDIQHIFETNEQVYVQSYDGSIWQKSASIWQQISRTQMGKRMPPLTGVAMIGDTTYFGFNADEGIGQLKDGKIALSNEISYVFELVSDGHLLWALTASGLYLDDGQDWSRHPAQLRFDDYKKLTFVPADQQIVCVLLDGLYKLTPKTAQKFYNCDGNSIKRVRIVNQKKLLVVHEDFTQFVDTTGAKYDIDLPYEHATITDAASIDSQVVLTTQHGLWIKNQTWQHFLTDNSGLGSNMVTRMEIVDNACWIFGTQACTKLSIHDL